MYAIVKVGGKQYRVEKGDSILVDRMPEDEGAKVALEPLLLAGDGNPVLESAELAKAQVEAVVTGHERGPKVRVLKFKPKKGYKRRTGHRQALTRLEVTDIKLGARRAAPKKPAADKSPEPAASSKAAARKPATRKPRKEKADGS